MSDIDAEKLEKALAYASAAGDYMNADQKLLLAAARAHLTTLPRWKNVEVVKWILSAPDGDSCLLYATESAAIRECPEGWQIVRLTGRLVPQKWRRFYLQAAGGDAMSDGVALTSTSHPRDERLIEAVCRAICRAEGVDPDAEGYGLGVCMPVGAKYRLWEARRRQAEAAIEACEAYQDTLERRDIDPAALETVWITLPAPQHKSVDVWRVEFARWDKLTTPQWSAEIINFPDEASARACEERLRSGESHNREWTRFDCINVTGPHRQRVPV